MAFRCVKYTFFVANVLLLLVGCAILGLGIWLLKSHLFGALTPPHSFLSATSIFIAAGCIVLLSGFLGFLGAIRENQWMMMTYSILVLLVLILEIVAAFMFKNELFKVVEDDMKLGIKTKYNVDGQKRLVEAWDNIQEEFKCCGANNYTDWFLSQDAKIPDSCCIRRSPRCGENSKQTNIYMRGCRSSIMSIIQQYVMILGLLPIAIVQILGMAAAMALFCSLRQKTMALVESTMALAESNSETY